MSCQKKKKSVWCWKTLNKSFLVFFYDFFVLKNWIWNSRFSKGLFFYLFHKWKLFFSKFQCRKLLPIVFSHSHHSVHNILKLCMSKEQVCVFWVFSLPFFVFLSIRRKSRARSVVSLSQMIKANSSWQKRVWLSEIKITFYTQYKMVLNKLFLLTLLTFFQGVMEEKWGK